MIYNGDPYPFQREAAAEFAQGCEKLRAAASLTDEVSSEILGYAYQLDNLRISVEAASVARARAIRNARRPPLLKQVGPATAVMLIAAVGSYMALTPESVANAAPEHIEQAAQDQEQAVEVVSADAAPEEKRAPGPVPDEPDDYEYSSMGPLSDDAGSLGEPDAGSLSDESEEEIQETDEDESRDEDEIEPTLDETEDPSPPGDAIAESSNEDSAGAGSRSNNPLVVAEGFHFPGSNVTPEAGSGPGDVQTGGGKAAGGLGSLLPIVAVKSSRRFFERHPPELVTDGRLDTSWQSKRRRKRKLWVEVDLGVDARVTAIEIANGCQGTSSEGAPLFALNARMRRANLSFDRGPKKPISFEGRGTGFARFALDGRVTRTIRVELRRYIWGSRWHKDVCISEIRVYGTPAE